jgi:phospho-N-acetylmuramoyl-pentapeptide-transferase
MSGHLTPAQIAVPILGAVLLVLALGAPTIRLLGKAGAGQRVRDDGPQRHLQKEGTPTMGGLLIVGAAVVAAAAAGRWLHGGLSFGMGALLAAMVAFATIGAADDWMKIRRGRSLGLRARYKLLLQIVVSAAFVYALAGHRSLAAASVTPPAARALTPLWFAFWVVAVTATSNAVNLSDGLDGLATGLCAIASAGFALIALKAGEEAIATAGLALAGACLGFLFFNRHPARVFMGDVGSLALGGALAVMAAWLDSPLALIGLCLVPFIEAGSVVVQVVSFKATGKRVFKMSPLHHHFELVGWSEQRVVLSFWLVALVAAAAVVGIPVRA